MKLKELIKIYKQLKGKSGCIVITKDRGGALAVRYGDFTNKEICDYTRGFNNGN